VVGNGGTHAYGSVATLLWGGPDAHHRRRRQARRDCRAWLASRLCGLTTALRVQAHYKLWRPCQHCWSLSPRATDGRPQPARLARVKVGVRAAQTVAPYSKGVDSLPPDVLRVVCMYARGGEGAGRGTGDTARTRLEPCRILLARVHQAPTDTRPAWAACWGSGLGSGLGSGTPAPLFSLS
jgi:hypothetical protein